MNGQDTGKKTVFEGLEILEEHLGSYGLSLNETKRQQMLTYYDMLVEKNKVMNLTAITEFKDVIYRHYLDSLYVCKAVPMQNVKTMIDVGTGAGFPGFPVKILFPDIKVVLLDSLNKRIGFLNEVINETGLKNIETIHARAEEAGRDKKYREAFDLCTSRAVSRLCTLSEYCIPFVRKDGCFISWKSDKSGDEIKEAETACKVLGAEIERTVPYDFSDGKEEYHRSLVVIRKKKPTGLKYPRKAGLPQKEPIGVKEVK